MDCNLKKKASFFKFFLRVLDKSLKNMIIVYSSLDKSLDTLYYSTIMSFHQIR